MIGTTYQVWVPKQVKSVRQERGWGMLQWHCWCCCQQQRERWHSVRGREMTANGERAVVLARAGEGVDGEVGGGVGEGVEAGVILGLGLGLGLLTVVGDGLGAVVGDGLGAVVAVGLGAVVGVGVEAAVGDGVAAGDRTGFTVGLGVATGVGLVVAATVTAGVAVGLGVAATVGEGVAAGVGEERAGVASGDVPAGGDCGDAGVALSGDAFPAGGGLYSGGDNDGGEVRAGRIT